MKNNKPQRLPWQDLQLRVEFFDKHKRRLKNQPSFVFVMYACCEIEAESCFRIGEKRNRNNFRR